MPVSPPKTPSLSMADYLKRRKSGTIGFREDTRPISRTLGTNTQSVVNPNPISSVQKYGPEDSAIGAAADQQRITAAANNSQGSTGTGSAPGTSGQGNSGYDANSTDPFTGFASRYAPGDASTLYQNPQVIANDVLSQMGLNTPGMRQLIGQNADAAFYLSFLLNGQDPTAQGDEASINTMADYFKNQATAGGLSPDYNSLIRSILNPGGMDNNPLAQYLNVADPSTQVSNLLQLARPALNSVHPLTQKAGLGYLSDLGDQFLSSTAGGDQAAYNGNFGNFIQRKGGLYGVQ
jgi:hypothetical protein